MPNDPYQSVASTPGSPASYAFEIDPGDNELPFLTSVIYVGNGGDVKLRPGDSDTDITYRNVPSGAYLTVRASHVRAVGTSASDLIGEV